jgi:hypothetical protein
MSLGYIWWNSVRPWASGETTPSWSWEVGTAPASTVYAFTSMQSLETQVWTLGFPSTGYHDIAVYSGISSFVKGGINITVGNGKKYGVVPGIFESDVTAVTFSWGMSVPGGVNIPHGFQNLDDTASADFTFQVFGWE